MGPMQFRNTVHTTGACQSHWLAAGDSPFFFGLDQPMFGQQMNAALMQVPYNIMATAHVEKCDTSKDCRHSPALANGDFVQYISNETISVERASEEIKSLAGPGKALIFGGIVAHRGRGLEFSC
jgi:hypothetical protein